MKHQEYIDKFKRKGEFDGNYHIIYLDGFHFLSGIFPYSDIVAAYMDPNTFGVDFSVHDMFDIYQGWMSFGDFPFQIQKELITFIKNY